MEIPVSSAQEGIKSAEMRELHTRFTQLRSAPLAMPILSTGFQFAGNKMSVSNPPILNMSSTTRGPYPGLDGHPRRPNPISPFNMGSIARNPNLGLGDRQRRITPTPIFVGQSQAVKMDGNSDQRPALVVYKSPEEI